MWFLAYFRDLPQVPITSVSAHIQISISGQTIIDGNQAGNNGGAVALEFQRRDFRQASQKMHIF